MFGLLQGQITLMDAPVFKAIQPEVRYRLIRRDESSVMDVVLHNECEWDPKVRTPRQKSALQRIQFEDMDTLNSQEVTIANVM